MIPIRKNPEPTVIISGFIGVAESWDFLTLDQQYLLPHEVKVSTLEDSSLHGMVVMRDVRQVYQIDFGYHQGYSLSQVVLCQEKGQIPLTAIKNEFIAAVDGALEHVLNQDGDLLCADETCRKYSQVLSSCRCSDCSFFDSAHGSGRQEENTEDANLVQENGRRINGKHLKAFGSAFNEIFRKKIQILQEDSKTFTVCKRLEQSYELFENYMPWIDICKFHEISIAFVKEYASSDCVILWNREAVVAHMHGRIPNQEYYPGLLNKFGNFTYKLKPTEEDSIQIVRMEFSSGLFKQLRYSNKMFEFSKPLIADFLAFKGEHKLVGKLLNRIRLVLLGDADKLSPSAQFGAMLTSRRPTLEKLQQMLNIFNVSSKLNPSTLFTAYPVHDFKRYIDETLLPPFRTLAKIYQEKVDIDLGENTYAPTIESLKLASLCEAIVCFGINGTARGFENTQIHPDQLLLDFGLLHNTFKKGELFQGLRNLNNVGVVDDKLVILDYSKVELYVNVFYNVGKKDQVVLEKSLTDIKNWHMEVRPLKKIAKLFWLSIKKFVIDTHLRERGTFSDLRDIANLARDEDLYIKLMSCTELIEFLNSPSAPNLPICTQFLKIVQKNLDADQFSDFLEACVEFFENRLYYSATPLLLPVRNEGYNIVVLPFRTTDHWDFDKMDTDDWKSIFQYYEMIYERFYDSTIPKIEELLVKVQKDNCNTRIKLDDVFETLDELNLDGESMSIDGSSSTQEGEQSAEDNENIEPDDLLDEVDLDDDDVDMGN